MNCEVIHIVSPIYYVNKDVVNTGTFKKINTIIYGC